MSQTVTLEIPLTISDDVLHSIIPFGEISYWASIRDSENGFIVTEHEPDEDDPLKGRHEVSYDNLRSAFVDCYRNAPLVTGQRLMGSRVHSYFVNSVTDAYDGEPEWGDIDADAADVWMQIAVFGQIVYG